MRPLLRTGLILAILVSVLSPIKAYAATTYSFTNAGITGPIGPTQAQITSAYSGTSLAGNVTITTQGIQEWLVPNSGSYSFTVVGAHGAASTQGSNTRGGRSVRITATKSLTAGTKLFIVVGQAGTANANHGGGGGASFVRIGTGNDNSNLIVAGGGGGTRQDASANGGDASTSTSGMSPGSTYSSGSTTTFYSNTSANSFSSGSTPLRGTTSNAYTDVGYGGQGAGSCYGDGGSGWFGDGYDDGGGGSAVAKALSTTALGGGSTSSVAQGGFGGGGHGAGCNGGGGGGGYTGGNGGWVAGGGGSYANGFSTPSLTVDTSRSYARAGTPVHGFVAIESLGPSLTTFSPTTTLTNSSNITYNIVFSEAVTGLASNDFSVSGTGSSTCTIGAPSGSGTTYTVALSGCSPGTVILTMLANAITNADPQTAPGSNTAAATVVIDQTAPIISSVSAPSNSTYLPAGALNFTVNFSESVTVTGSPRLTLTVGSLTKYASFVSLTDSKTATFRYTVATASGEFDTDGIAVSTTLDLNSGAIADLATNALSPLTFTAPTLTSVLVAQTPAAPTITSITPSSGTLSVAFTAGATNGSAISNYEYSTDNGSNWTTRSPVATTSPISISGLTNGTAYNVRIRAVNGAGSGDSSTAVSATPSAVVVSGDATLTTTYGSAASTTTYTSTGGTSPYTYTLSATPSGVSISGGVVTASASTAAGTYTQNVIATDSAFQTGSKQLVITVNKASTTITIALPNSATDAPLGGAITITATVSQAGSVNFKLGGSSISGCSSVSSSAGTATCSWTPGALGGASLTAVLTPSDSTNYEVATTTTLSVTVVNGVTTVSLSLAGGVTQAPKGQNIVITATVDQAGRISFFADGKRIAGCYNKAVSGSTKTCTWKPAVQKQVTLTSTLNPTNSAYSNSTGSLKVWVVRRTGTR
ncbi:Fibronectin type III [Candidatus Nanopelagicaceae bacterium]